MAKKVINYEEDIFFLNLMLKTLKDGLKLDIDASFFTKKVKEDIHFMTSIIGYIFKSLSENTHMLKRLEYLKSLQRLMQQFTNLLEDLARGKLLFSAALESSLDEYKSLCLNYENNIRTIKDILADLDNSTSEQENIVSQEEFKFLLFHDEEGNQ